MFRSRVAIEVLLAINTLLILNPHDLEEPDKKGGATISWVWFDTISDACPGCLYSFVSIPEHDLRVCRWTCAMECAGWPTDHVSK